MKHWKLMAVLLVSLMLLARAKGQEDEEQEEEEDDEKEHWDEDVEEAKKKIARIRAKEPGPLGPGAPDSEDSEYLTRTFYFSGATETDKASNFRKISEEFNVLEKEYMDCINNIADFDLNEANINGCLGENFIKLILDIKYQTLRVMAKGDTRVREIFVDRCYQEAGVVEEFTVGCDTMERDTLDLLWNGLDFIELFEINKNKYLFEYGRIPVGTYDPLIASLSSFAAEFFEILDEVEAHKESVILRIKTLLRDRVQLIQLKLRNKPEIVDPIYYRGQTIEAPGGPSARKAAGIQPGGNESPAFSSSNEAFHRLQRNHLQRQAHAAKLKYQPSPLPVAGQLGPNGHKIFNSGHAYRGLYGKQNRSKSLVPGLGSQPYPSQDRNVHY